MIKNSCNVVVVGGGAAGMMAAIWAARQGADVILFEKNEKLGKKIYITGKAGVILPMPAISRICSPIWFPMETFYIALFMDLPMIWSWIFLRSWVVR